jgi:uncharacterized protein YceK
MRKCVYIVVAAALAAVCSGCLSVVRLTKLDDGKVKRWSEEKQAYVVHERKCENADLLATYGLYPTMRIRWQLLRRSCYWAPKRCYWGQHVGIPCALIGITPGMLVDVVVDTLSLPWDWKYRHNVGKDMCAELDKEREYRSVCVHCGATSDGEFARCRRTADRNNENWNKYYGCCPDCIEAVKADGYYFEER